LKSIFLIAWWIKTQADFELSFMSFVAILV
jgi:hypothetical protein